MSNRNSTTSIKDIIIAVLSVALCVSLFFNITSPDAPVQSDGGKTILSLMPGTDTEIEMEIGTDEIGWLTVSGANEASADGIKFVSSDESVARIAYEKTSADTYVYYKISALSEGTAQVFAQSADGASKTDVISVSVSNAKSAGTALTGSENANYDDTHQAAVENPSESIGDISDEVVSTYILNTSSKRFHLPSCGGVATMKEHNKQTFEGTRDDALAAGYTACGTCKP